MDYGFQLGGPVFKDRLWFWLGFGVQDTRRLTISGYPQDYMLYNFNAKLNAQLSSRNRAELAFYVPLKYAYGRGASATVPPESTTDQKPKNTFYVKLEDEHIFSPDFLLSLKVSYLRSAYELIPKGGFDVQAGQDQITGMYSGTMTYVLSERPNFNLKLDGNYFREKFLGGSHEFRFGLEYRYNEAQEYWYDPGDVWKYYRSGKPYVAYVERQMRAKFGEGRYSFFLTDAYTRGRFTLNLGLRVDREKSWIMESAVQASRSGPDLLPALSFPAIDPDIAPVTLSPRVGITFDLTGDAKTMLRASLARYGGQMATIFSGPLNPAQAAYAGYFWNDLNGDDRVTTNELTGYPLAGILAFSGFANARQGYIFPERLLVTTPERAKVGLGATMLLYTAKPGEKRYRDFYNVDLSLAKTFRIKNYGSVIFQADSFNVFNFSHELDRYPQANSPRYNQIQKILNPRVIRFGLRYNF